MQNIINKVKTALKNSKGTVVSEVQQRDAFSQDFPPDFSLSEIEAIKKVLPFTMTSPERLVSLYRVIDYIEESKIEGEIVECGVWKGGSMMLVANRLISLNSLGRNLFLFDTYEGMTEPTEKDTTFNNNKAADLLEQERRTTNNNWCYSSIEEVKTNLFATGYDKNKINFIKGKVEETLPCSQIDKIALLRLDTDWYESTKHELETLYERLMIGGVLIIDDYGHWSGAKKAVDDFFKERKIKIFLNRVDYTCRLAVKN